MIDFASAIVGGMFGYAYSQPSTWRAEKELRQEREKRRRAEEERDRLRFRRAVHRPSTSRMTPEETEVFLTETHNLICRSTRRHGIMFPT